MQIAVAHAHEVDVAPFWKVLFGYTDSDSEGSLVGMPKTLRTGCLRSDSTGTAPTPNRGSAHIDVHLPADQAEATLQAALDAGGRLGRTSNPPHWWTRISPDGPGVDLAPWQDRTESLE